MYDPESKEESTHTLTEKSLIPSTLQSTPDYAMTGSDTTDSDRPATPPLRAFGFMPRPGQPGAPFFDDTNVIEFLHRWNIECEDFRLSKKQRCVQLPDYCTSKTKDVIKLFEEYINNDWEKLQDELKALFWQHDKQKNTPAALNQLIREAPEIDLNVYVLKYTAITDALIKGNEMSAMQRCKRFLDGLSERLRDKAFDFCTTNDWKLSAHDTGTKDPDFGELKKFILAKAQSAKKKVVYNKERATEGYEDLKGSDASIIRPTTPPAPATSPVPTPVALDSVAELTKQFSRLALIIEANMQANHPPTSTITSGTTSTPTPKIAPTARTFGDRPRHCVWCDSLDHFRRAECSELQTALRMDRVRVNDQGHIISAATGDELPLMYGKGGMKRFFELSRSIAPVPTPAPTVNNIPTPVTSSSVTNITFDDEMYGNLGGSGSIHLTTLDFQKGTRIDEIIDVDVYEKRKWNEFDPSRRVRSRIDNAPLHPQTGPEIEMSNAEQPQSQPSQPYTRSQPDLNMNAPTPSPRPTATYQPPPVPDAVIPNVVKSSEPKFHLGSELSQSISAAQIAKKILGTTVELSVEEVLAVSSDVSGCIYDQARKRRIPNEPIIDVNPSKNTTVNSNANVNSVRTFYACPSGHAKVSLNREINVDALLDDGSELNLMPRHTFERTNLPIDPDINWRINGYDSKTKAGLENLEKKGGVIGVCHDVPVDIGGIEVRQHIFVVEHTNSDLILGMPWRRSARLETTFDENGSYMMKIKSQDGRRVAQWIAAPGEHERNREFARDPEDRSVNHLKV